MWFTILVKLWINYDVVQLFNLGIIILDLRIIVSHHLNRVFNWEENAALDALADLCLASDTLDVLNSARLGVEVQPTLLRAIEYIDLPLLRQLVKALLELFEHERLSIEEALLLHDIPALGLFSAEVPRLEPDEGRDPSLGDRLANFAEDHG
jgi:hypothetical protein